MASRKPTPTVRLRRLAAELRRLRTAANLSQEQASERTGINEATLYRLEHAKARPQMRTLRALLDLYEVSGDQREHLQALCRESNQQGWLRPYHSDLTEGYTAYISFEHDAVGLRNYESLFIPGLLQTEAYAEAVVRGALPSATPAEVEHRVQARMERQVVLTKDSPLALWSVVDEAALRRLVGGPETMREQLGHLLEAVKAHNVTFQVIPFDAGAHPGMPGQFVLMSFGDPMDPDLIYIDSMAGDLFLEADPEVRRYKSIFDNIVAVAHSPKVSAALVVEVLRDLERR